MHLRDLSLEAGVNHSVHEGLSVMVVRSLVPVASDENDPGMQEKIMGCQAVA